MEIWESTVQTGPRYGESRCKCFLCSTPKPQVIVCGTHATAIADDTCISFQVRQHESHLADFNGKIFKKISLKGYLRMEFVSTRQNREIFWREILMTDHTRLLFFLLIILGKIYIRFNSAHFFFPNLNAHRINSLSLTKLLAPSHEAGPCELRGLQAGFGGWAALDCGGVWLGETQLPFGTDFPWLWKQEYYTFFPQKCSKTGKTNRLAQKMGYRGTVRISKRVKGQLDSWEILKQNVSNITCIHRARQRRKKNNTISSFN